MVAKAPIIDWRRLRERVRGSADIADYAELSGFQRRGRQWLCGFHEDRTPSASIRRERIRCFSCNESWDAIALVMRSRQIGFRDAVLAMAVELGIETPSLSPAAVKKINAQESMVEGEALRLLKWREDTHHLVRAKRDDCYKTYHGALRFLRRAYRKLNHIPDEQRVAAAIHGPDAPLISFAESTCLRCEEQMPVLDDALAFIELATFEELLPLFREEIVNAQ